MKVYQYFKAALDFFMACLMIIFLSPLLILLSFIIKLDSSGSILFRQKRIGRDCKEFYIFKFRTMRTDTPKDRPTHLFRDAENYTTRTGKFLRKTSLDELPQLFNILKGEMAFIGPRPALWNQYDLIEARANQITKYNVDANSVKPGITGWAQVNGRDELEIKEKADFDGYYVAHLSALFDIKILFMTIISIITKKGFSEGSSNPHR